MGIPIKIIGFMLPSAPRLRYRQEHVTSISEVHIDYFYVRYLLHGLWQKQLELPDVLLILIDLTSVGSVCGGKTHLAIQILMYVTTHTQTWQHLGA